MRIRILHMIGSLNMGGSQTMIINLYRKIDKDKVQFDFIVDHPKELHFADEIKKMGGKIFFMPTFKGYNIVEVRSAWENFLKKHGEYRILHSHVRSYASLYIPIAKKYGLKTIIHSHSTSNGKGISSIIKKILQYPLRFQADYFFACSKESGEWLFGKKATETNRFYILKNAINVSAYAYSETARDKIRNEFHISQSAFVVGHVGRFIYAKNHSFLLEVFKAVHDKNPDAVLLLVGDGELKEQIQQKVKSLNLQKYVIFTGVRSDIPDLLSAMDVFVFPSNFEGLPVTLVEAQASGLNIFASDIITDEVNLTNLFHKISLQDSSKHWSDEILKMKDKVHADFSKQIVETGYDIHQTAQWMESFYFMREKEVL